VRKVAKAQEAKKGQLGSTNRSRCPRSDSHQWWMTFVSRKPHGRKTMKLLLAAFVSFVLALSFGAASVAAGPFKDGEAAYDRGDYTTALRLYRPIAEQGNSYAQYEIGRM
jgi:hypothetical protein